MSRGLGDVYKRQGDGSVLCQHFLRLLKPPLSVVILYCNAHDLRELLGKIAVAIVENAADIRKIFDIGQVGIDIIGDGINERICRVLLYQIRIIQFWLVA